MSTPQELYDAFLLSMVHDTLRGWFGAGVESVALANGFPVETFTADDPPCKLQSARARGLEVLSLLDLDDTFRISEALVLMTNNIFVDGIAHAEAQGFSAMPVTRGQA